MFNRNPSCARCKTSLFLVPNSVSKCTQIHIFLVRGLLATLRLTFESGVSILSSHSMSVYHLALRRAVSATLLWLLVCIWSFANVCSYRVSWVQPGSHPSRLSTLMPRLGRGLSNLHFTTTTSVPSKRISTSLHAFKRIPVLSMPLISPSEQELFDVMLRVVAECKLNTTVRVAGGWVRDRLLRTNNQKFDVDFALENMSGVEFRNHLQTWLRSPQNNLPHPFRLSVIPQNVEKSKHLETGMHLSCSP